MGGVLYKSKLKNAVAIISILDLSLVCIPLLYESLTLGYYVGIIDPFGHLEEDCAKNCSSWYYAIYRESKRSDSFHFSTVTVATLFLFILSGAFVEGYLFAMLRKGIREEIHYFCRKWFRIRSFLLVLIVLGSLGKYMRSHYELWEDGLFDIFKIYRVLELIVVRCYMDELARTVGVEYSPPQKEAKAGSLGDEDFQLLD